MYNFPLDSDTIATPPLLASSHSRRHGSVRLPSGAPPTIVDCCPVSRPMPSFLCIGHGTSRQGLEGADPELRSLPPFALVWLLVPYLPVRWEYGRA